jgi:hypothetical protein
MKDIIKIQKCKINNPLKDSYKKKFSDDKQLGDLEEERIIKVIEKKWDVKLFKNWRSSVIDFTTQNNEYHIELKSRRNDYNKYPTTMVGYNKIEYIKKHNLSCIFVFAFTDGDYYYIYNENDEFKINIGGRCDRGKPEFKKYYYIPIEKLIRL